MPEKHCPRCVKTHPRSEFYANRSAHDGLDTYCKTCRSAIMLGDGATPAQKKARDDLRNTCSKCGAKKPRSEFYKGRGRTCKECDKAASQARRAAYAAANEKPER